MKFALPLACAAAAIGMAAPAHADGNDQTFLAQLRAAGITYQNPALAVNAGHSVCQLLDEGKSAQEISKELDDRNPSFQGTGAASFTTISAAAYCPKYLTGEGRGPNPAEPAGN